MLRTWRLRVALASRSAIDGEWQVRSQPLKWQVQVHTPAAHLRVLAAALEVEQAAARTRAAELRPAPCSGLRPRVMEDWRWRARGGR